ncbi:hypothetical protein E5676_scaffold347G001710 [Cucumis melo var. makuwa]|uniref:Uncharacterized protein n=1 Tax=Cucumis melo var. makuwa TaxID=1194695 RepID=A0A5D3BYB6_CUCMM|nr:hypothetical protein E6C27_scaffold242G00780 [Cucumis melo var. makuwa]TYK03974.1 hypothetical protein E5676_scaffold347G001710 [Cucumis melo var. makuwa]
MRARLVVFPIRGRNWCFSRSIDPTVSDSASAQTPSTFKDLWTKISSSSSSSSSKSGALSIANASNNAEIVTDFISFKMNKAWTALEKAPDGSFKNKLHGIGLKLLSRVKPSEIFLKSITKDVTSVETTYPSSLNPRLVRRRLRHIAFRGTVIHRKYFYGSVSLLPLASAFTILPLPNIPFFWVLFRTYSHWRALQGSEKLLQLVSDRSYPGNSSSDGKKNEDKVQQYSGPALDMQPSKELDKFLSQMEASGDITAIRDICKMFDLNIGNVLKYKDAL